MRDTDDRSATRRITCPARVKEDDAADSDFPSVFFQFNCCIVFLLLYYRYLYSTSRCVSQTEALNCSLVNSFKSNYLYSSSSNMQVFPGHPRRRRTVFKPSRQSSNLW